MTSFLLESDGSDGLLLIDKANLIKLSDEHLAALDILLDRDGETELRCDFPEEVWSDVWNRETRLIRDFLDCGDGFIALVHGGNHVCEITVNDNMQTDASGYVHLPTGDLIGMSASEAIQYLSYPSLGIHVPFQKNIEPGWYSIKHESGLSFCLSKTNVPSDRGYNLLISA